VAIAGHREAARRVCLGLHALQHRGRAAASIVASDGTVIRQRSGAGTVVNALPTAELSELRGGISLGQVHRRAHTRMSYGRTHHGPVAVAMAGRFSNGERLRGELREAGAVFTTGTDSEVLIHLIARSTQRTAVNRIVDALWKVEGSFSAIFCTEDRLVAVRDPRGFRPLSLGYVDGATAVATSDTALRAMGGRAHRLVNPGEMVILDATSSQSVQPFPRQERAACVQEFVAVAARRADAFGMPVYPVRVGLGERLAKEHPCEEADVVIGLPGDGAACALGFSKVAGLPFREALVTLEPPRAGWTAGDDDRLRAPFAAVPAVVQEKHLVLVVSALSTGDQISQATRALREAGARAIHLRIASPPLLTACPFGVASPATDELAWPGVSGILELSRRVDADSVGYLSRDGLHAVVGKRNDGTRLFCDACFSGNFPVPPEEPEDQLPLF
jgi:amidophosphoribosyltransferase